MSRFKHRKGKKPVVLICSALSSRNTMTGMDFFAVVAARLSQNLASNYDLVIKVPFEDYNVASQNYLIQSVLERASEFSGIILVPIDTDSIKDEIIKFLKQKPDYPLCTFDLGYSPDDKDFDGVPPPFVKVNGKHGGECAAEALDYYFKNKRINAPCVYILKGMKSSEERISGFNNKIASLFKGAEKIFETRAIPWEREKAEYEVTSILELMKTSKLGYYVNAFFCCNDEMALGTRDALVKFEKNNKDYFNKNPRIKIVGFDGIRDVTIHLDSKDPWIMNTVVVHLENQLQELAHKIEQMIEQKKPYKEVESYQQNCTLYIQDVRNQYID